MNAPQSLEVNPRQLLDLYLKAEYEQLSEKFIHILQYFESRPFIALTNEEKYFIDLFIKNFLYLFTQPDYTLADVHLTQFIRLNTTISNLTKISSFATTDPYISLLKQQPFNFVKILTLYSARNSADIEYNDLFSANPTLACLWYSCFLELYRSGLGDAQSFRRLKVHLSYSYEKLTDFYNISDLYFGSTYIDPCLDREIKQKINRSIQNSFSGVSFQIRNQPNPKKIAIITSLWFTQHSVYRTLSRYVESLEQDYELTLVHLGGARDNIDIGPFKRAKYVAFEAGALNISSIQTNDFSVIYYPDIGMTPESIFLANLRIAPIQICGTGHPVSTYGSEIDYFMSGADVEVTVGAEAHYSERLVLLPGFGAIHNPPDYQRQGIKKERPELIINCSWFSQKVNYAMLCMLSDILHSARKPLLFRFFSGSSLMLKNDYLAFESDLKAMLGEKHFELIPGKPYAEYMAIMEEGDFCLEAYPFGGSNTVADSLYLGKPTITFEGQKWFNRIGSQMLRSAGLPELIATNTQVYVELALKLIHDDSYRRDLQQRLDNTDLNNTIFSDKAAPAFKRAIDLLIRDHEQLKHDPARKPIQIF
jgi:hypothetical protein